MATREDVAKLAGVSNATVSRVFSQRDTVSGDKVQRVLSAARELNYFPDVNARNLASKTTRNIGVSIPFLPKIHIFSTYYFSEILSGIGAAANQAGFDLMLFFRNAGQASGHEEYFKSKKVDACILLGTREEDREEIFHLKKQGYSFILINNYFKDLNVDFVDMDHVSGSCLMTKHLIGLGHRRIAFVNGPKNYRNSQDRLKGYKKALAESGIIYDKKLVFSSDYSRTGGYRTVELISMLKPFPDAIFAGNDRMAAGMIQGLQEKGIRIPGDVSVAGYDNSDIAALVSPPLTTINVPFYSMGETACRRIIERIRDPSGSPVSLRVQPELISRDSAVRKTGYSI